MKKLLCSFINYIFQIYLVVCEGLVDRVFFGYNFSFVFGKYS